MSITLSSVKAIPSMAVSKARPVAKAVARKVGPKAPEILLGSGIAAIGTGTVLACVRSAKDAPQIIADARQLASDVRETNDDEKVARRGVTTTYLHMGGELAKVYAVPASVILAGVGCIIASHNIQRNRIVALGVAYNTLLTTFNEYRSRVVEKEGKDADMLYLYGEREETVVEQKTGKNGKVTEKEKKVKVLGTGDGDDLYHRCFDIRTSSQWCKDIDYNLAFILAQERIANQKLQANGYLFLDEVYEALGFSLDGYSNAKNVGWMLGMGDDHVDFGIYNPDADLEERATNLKALREGQDAPMDEIFLNGYNNAIWLNFNCDGVIIDKI